MLGLIVSELLIRFIAYSGVGQYNGQNAAHFLRGGAILRTVQYGEEGTVREKTK